MCFCVLQMFPPANCTDEHSCRKAKEGTTVENKNFQVKSPGRRRRLDFIRAFISGVRISLVIRRRVSLGSALRCRSVMADNSVSAL